MGITELSQWMESKREAIAHGVALVLVTALYVASFPPIDVGEAAFVFLVPFFIWLRFRPSYRKVAWTSLAIGWVAWLILIFWLRHVTWLGTFLLSGVVGAHFMLWGLGTAWLARRCGVLGLWAGVPLAIGSAAWWVILEHVRSWIFTGFPWLPLAASQYQQPIMLQSAAFCGAWSISFILALMNVGIAGYLQRLVEYARSRQRAICPEFYLALSVMVAMTFMLLRHTGGQQREPAFRAGVMQPNVPQHQKWDAEFARSILDRIERQTLLLGAMKPDAIFWPEAVIPYPLNDDDYMDGWARRLVDETKAPIFAGAMAIEPDEEGEMQWRNSVFLLRPQYGLYPLYYSKRHLVPYGEYIPLRSLWPWIETIVPISGDILPGEKAILLPLHLEETVIQIGTLICYEDVYPGLARDMVRAGAGVLFVSTNSAWYGRTGASKQHMAHSVLRAVETRRPVLRVGNDGWSNWIDEYGHIAANMSPWEQEWTTWPITRDRRWVGKQTPYVERGDWFVWLCWALSLGSVGTVWLLRERRPVT